MLTSYPCGATLLKLLKPLNPLKRLKLHGSWVADLIEGEPGRILANNLASGCKHDQRPISRTQARAAAATGRVARVWRWRARVVMEVVETRKEEATVNSV